jgi:putative ABC transport system permease protein
VLTTALILAGGVGAFAGLGGLQQWRERAADRSLAALRAHDIRVDLPEGTSVPSGQLSAALARLPAGAIGAFEERLVAPSQIEARYRGGTVLAPARLIGIPAQRGAQAVDRLYIRQGRGLVAGTAAQAVLDWNFAHHFGLAPRGSVRIGGLGSVPYAGLGVTPQFLLILDDAGVSGGQSALAVVYLPLAAAQRASRSRGRVNQLVLRVGKGRFPSSIARELEAALAAALPGAAPRITLGSEEPVTRILYRDARNDEKTYLAFAVLILIGAALAAFNLVSRVVEAQRREIGIGMALGVEPRVLARRPLALGIQIGVLGALLGVPVGIGLAELIKRLFRDFLSLPIYASTFPLGFYAAGCALALLIPLLAALLPVVRATRMRPVDAIRTGYRAERATRAGAALRRFSLPGGALAQLPIRNLLRSPRRTVMSVVGLGAVLTAVVAVSAMIDSIRDVAERQAAAVLTTSPARLQVTLSGLRPRDSSEIRSLQATRGVERAEPGLTVAATASAHGRSLGLALSFTDPRSPIWHPRAVVGRGEGEGILLAPKAAADLHVAVGDTVALSHPSLAAGQLQGARSKVRVMGLHASPVRAFAFMNRGQAQRLGLGGVANSVILVPRSAAGRQALERSLFGREGVASVRPVAAEAQSLRTTVDQFGSTIQIVEFITLGLALLVAFTSTSVSLDEGRREYATMFAFGFPPRSGLRVIMTESLALGVLGTAIGIALGLAVSSWIVHVLMAETFPDLGARSTLSTGSVATAVAVGIIAVTAAPLMAFRRVRAMDVPSTLRVME